MFNYKVITLDYNNFFEQVYNFIQQTIQQNNLQIYNINLIFYNAQEMDDFICFYKNFNALLPQMQALNTQPEYINNVLIKPNTLIAPDALVKLWQAHFNMANRNVNILHKLMGYMEFNLINLFNNSSNLFNLVVTKYLHRVQEIFNNLIQQGYNIENTSNYAGNMPTLTLLHPDESLILQHLTQNFLQLSQVNYVSVNNLQQQLQHIKNIKGEVLIVDYTYNLEYLNMEDVNLVLYAQKDYFIENLIKIFNLFTTCNLIETMNLINNLANLLNLPQITHMDFNYKFCVRDFKLLLNILQNFAHQHPLLKLLENSYNYYQTNNLLKLFDLWFNLLQPLQNNMLPLKNFLTFLDNINQEHNFTLPPQSLCKMLGCFLPYQQITTPHVTNHPTFFIGGNLNYKHYTHMVIANLPPLNQQITQNHTHAIEKLCNLLKIAINLSIPISFICQNPTPMLTYFLSFNKDFLSLSPPYQLKVELLSKSDNPTSYPEYKYFSLDLSLTQIIGLIHSPFDFYVKNILHIRSSSTNLNYMLYQILALDNFNMQHLPLWRSLDMGNYTWLQFSNRVHRVMGNLTAALRPKNSLAQYEFGGPLQVENLKIYVRGKVDLIFLIEETLYIVKYESSNFNRLAAKHSLCLTYFFVRHKFKHDKVKLMVYQIDNLGDIKTYIIIENLENCDIILNDMVKCLEKIINKNYIYYLNLNCFYDNLANINTT